MKKYMALFLLAGGTMLASCGTDKQSDKHTIKISYDIDPTSEVDSNIVKVERYMPEFGERVEVFYNFNNFTQTIVRDHDSNSNWATYNGTRRGFDDLRGTERAELKRISAERVPEKVPPNAWVIK